VVGDWRRAGGRLRRPLRAAASRRPSSPFAFANGEVSYAAFFLSRAMRRSRRQNRPRSGSG
jgi:hypothetical protein